MIRLLYRRRPVVPKSSTCPFTVRLNVIAVLHSGQKVTTSGSPPTVSFAISCQIKIWIGYAFASFPTCTKITGSFDFSHASASEMEINWGSLRAGMPSLGGPPERISLYGTLCLLKSVVNSDVARAGGGSSGRTVGVTDSPG